MKLQRDGSKTFLFCYVTNANRDGTNLRKKGFFFMRDGKFYFQFAGTSFRMANSKKYQASLKLIDIKAKTWIAVNPDRKGREKSIAGNHWFSVVIEALKYELMDLIAE